jgi:hypothetical protein
MALDPLSQKAHRLGTAIGRATMTPGQRCDEIIKMIDKVLDADLIAELGTVSSRRQEAFLGPSRARPGLEAGP